MKSLILLLDLVYRIPNNNSGLYVWRILESYYMNVYLCLLLLDTATTEPIWLFLTKINYYTMKKHSSA